MNDDDSVMSKCESTFVLLSFIYWGVFGALGLILFHLFSF